MAAVTAGTMLSVIGLPAGADAQDGPGPSGLTAATIATYVVDVEAAAVDVRFETILTNGAAGVAFTDVFESIPVGAVDVSATADGRALDLTRAGTRDGFSQWSIGLPAPLDPGETLSLVLAWRLEADGEAVVVAPGIAAFEAYVGGTEAVTRSALLVEVPVGFRVVAAGDLEVVEGEDRVTMFTATAQPYLPVPIVAELDDNLVRVGSGADPRLTLADWAGDGSWSREVDRLLPEVVALLDGWFGPTSSSFELRRRPRLATDIDPLALPAAGTGAPVVTVGPDPDRTEFTHELAAVWLADLPPTEPWLLDGLADAVSGSPSDDPAATVVSVVAGEIGRDGMRRVVDVLRAGSISYPGAGNQPQPISADWRTVLDLFEQVGGASAAELFRVDVIEPADAPLLDRRAAARADYLALEDRAGDWALPPMLRVPMAAWDFDTFAARQAEVSDALVARDLLVAELVGVELELGGIARAAFEAADADMADVMGVLGRQASALEALEEAMRLVDGDRGLLAWIGLFGDDPDAELAAAVAAWDAGRYERAESLAHALTDRMDGAVGRGTLRLVLPALLVLIVVATLRGLVRRNRRAPRRAARRERTQPVEGS